MGERHVQVVGVRPEHREQYLRLHAAVWPGVEETIRAVGIRDYSIHLLGDLLIGVFDYVGDDFEADMARMAADPTTQEWWSRTDPCQVPLGDAPVGTLWQDAGEVWRLNESTEGSTP